MIITKTQPDTPEQAPRCQVVFTLQTYSISEPRGGELNTDMILTFRVKNLLDEDMYTAEWIRGRIISIIARSGRPVFWRFN